MLNISEQSINHIIPREKLKSFAKLRDLYSYSHDRLSKVLIAILVLNGIILFMPWTQNIRSRGELIALKPDQRPQIIPAIIGGRIDKWYVQEGEFVQKGDTILKLSEIKDAYFDPKLLENTSNQISAKQATGDSYLGKADALELQISALHKAKRIKISQLNNKIQQQILKIEADSMDWVASKRNTEIAKEQAERFMSLYRDGLRSLTDYENRQLRYQEALANQTSRENKLMVSSNELQNLRMELFGVEAEYADKIAKANAEKSGTLASSFDTRAEVNKLQSQYASYQTRASNYFVLAPQDGYVTQAKMAGIGETVYEGEALVSIMPATYDLAIQMYVKPLDLPLMQKGQKVMIQFDGWPAIIFSGWPSVSYGTYEGTLLAMDNFISPNGMYRILVVPAKNAHPWPEQLRVGAGVQSLTLLKDVRVWYEIWRQINGFPPDYYKPVNAEEQKLTSDK